MTTPIPGDPDQARTLAAQFATVETRAQEIRGRLRAIETGVGPQMWRGKAADGFAALLAETGPDLTRLAASYGAASQALATYATELAAARDAARAAEAAAAAATGDRDRATAARDAAEAETARHAATADEARVRLDPVAAQDADRRSADAAGRATAARAAADQAEQALQSAQRQIEQAVGQRDAAAARCVREVDAASRAGIDPRTLGGAPAAGGPPPATPAESGLLGAIGHTVLDVAGLVPGVGEVADVVNAGWYAVEGDYANAALSAAAAVPFLGSAATGGKLLRRGSGVIRGVDPAPGPHTPLAPQGGLKRHEDAGGHTLDPKKAHVGATEQEILTRLAQEPGRKAVSSYYDRAAAERAVSENIAGNHPAIQQWLDSGPTRNKAFEWKHDWRVGRRATQGTTSTSDVQDVYGSRVVLRPDASMDDGYRIQTAFPIPE